MERISKFFRQFTLLSCIKKHSSLILKRFGESICYYATAAMDQVEMLPSNFAASGNNLLDPERTIAVGTYIQECGDILRLIDTSLYTPEWGLFLKNWLMRTLQHHVDKSGEYRQKQQLRRSIAEANLTEAKKYVAMVTEHQSFSLVFESMRRMYRYLASLLDVIETVGYLTLSRVTETIYFLLIIGYSEKHIRGRG